LRSETRRQETEIEMFNSGGESRTACIARNFCHDFHRPASQEANIFAQGVSIAICDIYLRWRFVVIFIEKK
jgi:hypothetical protein